MDSRGCEHEEAAHWGLSTLKPVFREGCCTEPFAPARVHCEGAPLLVPLSDSSACRAVVGQQKVFVSPDKGAESILKLLFFSLLQLP